MARGRSKLILCLFMLVSMVIVIAACSTEQDVTEPGKTTEANTATPSTNTPKPEQIVNTFDTNQAATISFYNNIGVPDSYYTDSIEPHIRKKFPNVTVEYVNSSTTGNAMSDLIAANTVPDIILTTNAAMLNYVQLDALQTLDPLIKKNNLDISVFRDDMIAALQGYYTDGSLYALPWTYGTYALFYNKEIFDRFGVDYPRDGMTWDDPELRSMIEKLSRSDGDEQFRGLEFNLGLLGVNPLSLPFVNPDTEKAVVNTNEWQSFIRTLQTFYNITGNEKPSDTTFDGQKAFIEQKNVAMWVGNAVYPRLIGLEKDGQGFNWDIVSLPTFKEAPGMGPQYAGALYSISSTTKHADLAMQIISHLTSAEVQIEGGSLLRYPTLKAIDVKEAFGKGEDFLESKNMNALHLNQIAPTPRYTKYDATAKGILNTKVHEVMKGQKDVNTALREAEEEINAKINEEKAMGK